MDYGAHLPLIDLDRQPWTLHRLLEYAQTAESMGFQALSANDHLVFGRPWLDGPTALAAVIGRTGRMALATIVALPVVRGPVALAKSLAAIDLLLRRSPCRWGRPRLLGQGLRRGRSSLRRTLEALDEAVQALRALWQEGHRTGVSSTLRKASRWSPARRSDLGLLSGSGAGDRSRAQAGGSPG